MPKRSEKALSAVDNAGSAINAGSAKRAPERASFPSSSSQFASAANSYTSFGLSAIPRVTDYRVLLVLTVCLTIFGVLMVFSASSVVQMEKGLAPWGIAARQAVFALVGFAAMMMVSRLPFNIFKTFNRLAVFATAGLVIAVSVVGKAVGGNTNWIDFGGVSLQPSEFGKLTFGIWFAFYIADKIALGANNQPSKFFSWEFIGVVAVILGGVAVVGKDMGTGLIYVMVMVAIVFILGVRKRWMLIAAGVMAAAMVPLILTSGSRVRRIFSSFSGCTKDDIRGTCFQQMHARYALATGGITGVGPGASREKWGYLPESHNDVILAIIGEELGLIGTLGVLVIFCLLARWMIQVMIKQTDPRARAVAAGITAWIIGQAFLNMCVTAVTFFPTIGIPIPFLSYGGSSLVSSLMGMGVMLALARQETGVEFETRASKARAKKRKRRIVVESA